ncbi:MAG: hypothetical protein HKN68_13425, partial [Saprospiraceae bacterium]|nr:hypothetical protein [Saprospiraceae bacterium]
SFNLLAGWTPKNELGVFIQIEQHDAIYTVPASGGKAVQVSPEGKWPYYPRWSPDGKRIYYRGVDMEKEQIFTYSVSSDGSKPVEVSVQSDRKLVSIVPGGGHNISPNGNKMVISAYQEPYDPKEGVDLWTIPLDGGTPTRLTNDETYEGYPCWSPDGKWIAFIDEKTNNNDYPAIYIVPTEGGEVRQITTEADSLGEGAITFSPDGKNIAFFSDHAIKTIPLKGGLPEILVANIKQRGFPRHSQLSFSPDGSKIAYNGNGKIWVNSLKGGEMQTLNTGLPEAARQSEFSWSPDGKKITFLSSIGGEPEFWLISNFLPLDKLSQKKQSAEVAPKTTTLQKVKIDNVYFGGHAISPDGKFLTYSGEKDNMAIHEISTGKTHLLTSEATWEDPKQFYIGSIVSPNSKQIAYAWYKNNFEIRVIDVDNPQPKVIYGNKDEDVYPSAWSPDGKTIYAKSYLNKTGKCRILAINVTSGDVKTLKTFDFFYWLQLSVSSDNQFVSYHYPTVKNGEISDTDIHLVSTDGKSDVKLFEHPANDQVLGWFPDKNQLLFKSDRSGTWDAWTIEILNGKIAKEPVKVLSEMGENASHMGFTNNGAFYYSLMSRKFTGFISPLDQTNGKLNSKLSEPMLGSIRTAKWSPNGKSLALVKEIWNLNSRPIFILNTVNGNERMLSDRFNVHRFFWLQDNQTLILLGNDKQRESEKNYTGGVYTINIQSEEVAEILSFSDYHGKDWEIGLLVAQMLAKGNNEQKSIYYLKNGQLISRELATGEEKMLLQNQSFNSHNYTLDPSPGGKYLLFCNEEQLYIISTTGRKQIPIAKAITTTSGPTVPNSAVWSSDGKYIFYTENKGEDASILWRVSPSGENPKEVWQSNVPISSLSIHPEGQKIVMTTLSQGAEIWKVDNLLSEEEIVNSKK